MVSVCVARRFVFMRVCGVLFGSFVCARVCVFVGPEVFVDVFVAPWGLGTQRLLIFMFVSGQHVAVHNVLLTVHIFLVTGTMLLSLCCRHEFTLMFL